MLYSPSYLFEGILIEDESYCVSSSFFDIRPEIYPYFDEKTWTVEVPSQIIDGYLLSKFNTVVNHGEIAVYDDENDTYRIEPFQGCILENLTVKNIKAEDSLVGFTGVAEFEGVIEEVEIELEFIDGEYGFLKATEL